MRLTSTAFRNITFLLSFFFFFQSAFSEGGDYKKFRIGLLATPSINWYSPENIKKMKNNGIKPRFGWGITADIHFNATTALNIGVNADFQGGSLAYKKDVYYYYAKENIVPFKEIVYNTNYGDTMQLLERNYHVNYYSIPISLKMKTKEIGYFTYFGQFGLNTSIRAKATADDKVKSFKSGVNSTIESIDIKSDVHFFRFQLNIGFGAEYNLSGSTSIIAGIKYNYGISNVLYNGFLNKDSEYLFEKEKYSSVLTGYNQKAKESSVSLSVGIIF